MTPRIRALVAAEPLVPPFRSAKAPQIFREFVETLQRLHDSPLQPAEIAKSKNGGTRAKPKTRRARKTSR